MSSRVLVVGAGALGSVYGARLSQGGADVELLAREAHARAIDEAGGVVVERGDGSELVPVRAEWRPERVHPASTVIVLTKTTDTEAALAGLEHLRDHVDLAVSLQNGVEKDDVLASWCGRGAVVGGVSMVGGTLLAPGRVAHTLDGGTILGELPRGRSERVERLATALEAGGLKAVVSDDIRAVEWAKLVHASPTMAVPALVRLPLHACLVSEPLAALYVTLVREGVAIASAAGVEVDDEPVGYPLRAIASAPEHEAVALVRERGRALEAAGMTEIRVSMLQSVERGRRIEVDAVQGFLVREAARLGVEAPGTVACHRLLSGIDEQLA
jgi:2-dehydropantoate 2-reductase